MERRSPCRRASAPVRPASTLPRIRASCRWCSARSGHSPAATDRSTKSEPSSAASPADLFRRGLSFGWTDVLERAGALILEDAVSHRATAILAQCACARISRGDVQALREPEHEKPCSGRTKRLAQTDCTIEFRTFPRALFLRNIEVKIASIFLKSMRLLLPIRTRPIKLVTRRRGVLPTSPACGQGHWKPDKAGD